MTLVIQLCGFLHLFPLLQNEKQYIFICLHVHVLVLIHEVGHLF